MPVNLQFKLATGPGSSAAGRRQRHGALRLLVMGDFSGRPSAERKPLAERPTHPIDLDTLDTVLARLAPRVALTSGEIGFQCLDDFHPDALLRRLPLFRALREARVAPPQAGADLLGSLIGGPGPATAAAAAPAATTGLDAYIRGIVTPHVVADTADRDQAWRAGLDAATAEPLRAVLHDPAFQALESAWRGLAWLVQNLELDETLQLHLLDVGRDELLADLVAAQGRPLQTGLHRALADRWRNQPGAEGWSLLVGLYGFGPGVADVGLLAGLGLVAAQAGGPFVAAGELALADADPAALAGWQTLRRSEAAPWLGLVAPRLLLRLPYGLHGEPITTFDFDELPGPPVHAQLLWGAGSLAVALLTGRAFRARGWDFEPGDQRQIDDLPAYTFVQDGERELQACAEQYLGDQRAEALLAAGLMPLLSHRHANAVTLLRFQSVAAPATALPIAAAPGGP